MANTQQTLTAPLALIKVKGIVIGKMMNLNITENFQRGRIVGIGEVTPSELPVTGWSGSLTCSKFNIDFSKAILPGALVRRQLSVQDFVDTILLEQNGVQLDIMRKYDPLQLPGNGFPIIGSYEIFASVFGCFITQDGFNINDGAISSRNASFEYTTPIIYSPIPQTP